MASRVPVARKNFVVVSAKGEDYVVISVGPAVEDIAVGDVVFIYTGLAFWRELDGKQYIFVPENNVFGTAQRTN